MATNEIAAPEDFAEFIRSIGGFNQEVTDAMAQVVREINRVFAAGGNAKPKGKITIAIAMTLDRGVMDINPDVKISLPAVVRSRTIRYPLSDGRLSETDPRQLELLNAGEKGDVRSVAVTDIRSAQFKS